MDFRVLGPLEVVKDSRPVALNAAKQRTLLAVLICHRNSSVPSDQLIDALWGADPPRTAADNLRVYVYHLRRALGDRARIVRRPHGYAALIEPGELYVDRFGELVRQGQDSRDPRTTAAVLREALDVWRGAPYADLTAVPALHEETRRLVEYREAVLELHVDAELALGRHVEVIAELTRLVAAYPLRERLHAQLMLALHRAGRRAEALTVHDRLRVRLANELGLDPTARLRRLQLAVLRGDPTLDESVDTTPVRQAPVCPFPGAAPFGVTEAPMFAGRERLVAESMARLATHGMVALVGPSGSGKSSLAHAGLLATLAARHEIAVVRPPAALRTPPRGSSVLLVDQCEEVFTGCADPVERARFFAALSALVASRVKVIVTLRSDYRQNCAGFLDLTGSAVVVGPMSEAELRRAVERPAAQAGLRLADGLTDALVADVVGRPGALPLLARTLRALWKHRAEDTLTLDDYVATGGVPAVVAGLAERAHRELRAPQREAADHVLRRLDAGRVPAIEATGVVSRTLTDHHLIVADGETFELAHESVRPAWSRLRRTDDDVTPQKPASVMTAIP